MQSTIFKYSLNIAKQAGKKLTELNKNKHELVWGEKSFQGYQEVKAEADTTSETLILNLIQKKFPDHAILSEESGYQEPKNNSPYTWIIDPLHDTIAYVRGNTPEFSITIAIAKDNEVICSVLYQPMLNKLYSAQKNKGAFLNGEKIEVSKTSILKESNLSIQHNAFKYGDYNKVIPIIKNVRRMYSLGSAMFPELANSKVDIVISYKQALYDYATTKLLVEEAGGKVTQENGAELPLFFDNKRRFNIIATNGILHNKIIKALT